MAAKKSMKTAATAGTSVFDQIANGAQYTEGAQDVNNVQYVKNVKNVKDTNKKGEELARLNLKIPADVKEHLIVMAAKESIRQRRNVSPTEYFITLVRADMEKNG